MEHIVVLVTLFPLPCQRPEGALAGREPKPLLSFVLEQSQTNPGLALRATEALEAFRVTNTLGPLAPLSETQV
jgi:hypothetical protein